MKRNDIEYTILTRGEMLVFYKNKTAIIQGEGIYEPPMFYAWVSSFNHWESPYKNIPITDEEKKEIIDFITNESCKEGKTKIVFD